MTERIQRIIAIMLMVVGLQPAIASAEPPPDYRLAWHDEFDRLSIGPPGIRQTGCHISSGGGRDISQQTRTKRSRWPTVRQLVTAPQLRMSWSERGLDRTDQDLCTR